jgi:hypothetical protein
MNRIYVPGHGYCSECGTVLVLTHNEQACPNCLGVTPPLREMGIELAPDRQDAGADFDEVVDDADGDPYAVEDPDC